MMAAGSTGLWAAATAGSLAFHVLVGYTLFAMPMPETRPDAVTEIRFATPDDGTATSPTASTTTEAVNPRHGLARASAPVASTVLPGANSAELSPSAAGEQALAASAGEALDAVDPVALPPNAGDASLADPADAASSVEPVAPPVSELRTIQTKEALAPADRQAAAISGLREALAVTPNAIDSAVAEAANDPTAATAALSSIQEPMRIEAEQLAALEMDAALPVAAPREEVAPADDGTAALPASSAVPLPPSFAEPLVAPEVLHEGRAVALPSGPALDPNGGADEVPIPVRPDSAPVVIAPSMRTDTQAPSAGVSPQRVGTSQAPAPRAAVSSTPRASVGTATATGPAAPEAAPVRPAPAEARPVVIARRAETVRPADHTTTAVTDISPQEAAAPRPIAPADAAPRVTTEPAAPSRPIEVQPALQQTALLPIPQLDTEDDRPGSDAGALVRDFLRGRKGDECLLALPSQDAGVEAFAISGAAVETLAADFERQAKSALATTLHPVAAAQCSALGFARALPQYPNYLLQVHVTNPEIRSGETLQGLVSGVVKDTLYLVAVDDEGNAKLVDSGTGLTADTYRFGEPVHLTTAPVESVQLLIAVASDGPLSSMPDRAGQPADLFFSRLALEIISGDRSIAYGMGSFIVR